MRRHVRKRPCDVYRVYDKHDRLLYVGMSANAFQRIAQHRKEHQPWVGYAVYFTVDRYANRRAAAHIEAKAISEEGPKWNQSLNRSALECSTNLNLDLIEEPEAFMFNPERG